MKKPGIIVNSLMGLAISACSTIPSSNNNEIPQYKNSGEVPIFYMPRGGKWSMIAGNESIEASGNAAIDTCRYAHEKQHAHDADQYHMQFSARIPFLEIESWSEANATVRQFTCLRPLLHNPQTFPNAHKEIGLTIGPILNTHQNDAYGIRARGIYPYISNQFRTHYYNCLSKTSSACISLVSEIIRINEVFAKNQLKNFQTK